MKLSSYLAQTVALTAALFCGVEARAQSLSKDSPFIGPQTNMGSPSFGSFPLYTLVGVIGMDRTTRIGILDMRTRKSVWIPIGQTIGGIEAVSHNPRTDEVVVRVNGTLQMLSLRMPNINASPMSSDSMTSSPLIPNAGFHVATNPPQQSGALPPLAPNPSQVSIRPVGNTGEQEREARMLVSDLLEIGMQQRKAYQEAQKKVQQTAPGLNPNPSPSLTPLIPIAPTPIPKK
jgi:hypothetical protein